jgi:hypothetical protein
MRICNWAVGAWPHPRLWWPVRRHFASAAMWRVRWPAQTATAASSPNGDKGKPPLSPLPKEALAATPLGLARSGEPKSKP